MDAAEPQRHGFPFRDGVEAPPQLDLVAEANWNHFGNTKSLADTWGLGSIDSNFACWESWPFTAVTRSRLPGSCRVGQPSQFDRSGRREL